jgi:hypothetical protein
MRFGLSGPSLPRPLLREFDGGHKVGCHKALWKNLGVSDVLTVDRAGRRNVKIPAQAKLERGHPRVDLGSHCLGRAT